MFPAIILSGVPDYDADTAAGKNTLVVKLGIRGALIALRRGEAENVRIIRSTTGFETASSDAVDESTGAAI